MAFPFAPENVYDDDNDKNEELRPFCSYTDQQLLLGCSDI
jgi:hypothetical protein